MAIQHQHFAFPAAIPGNAQSGGDGGPGYSAITPSDRMSTAVGAESDHADVDSYQRAKQTAAGIKPGGGSGFSVGAADKLVVNDVLPKDSNITAAGLQI